MRGKRESSGRPGITFTTEEFSEVFKSFVTGFVRTKNCLLVKLNVGDISACESIFKTESCARQPDPSVYVAFDKVYKRAGTSVHCCVLLERLVSFSDHDYT